MLLPLPTDQWDGSLAEIIEEMNGAPLNVHKLMANNPALLRAWWSFRNYSINGGSLGARKGELVILRVGVQTSTWYEWASHVDRARHKGLTQEEINAVLLRETTDVWNRQEAALLTAVDNLIEDGGLSTKIRSRLAQYFSSQQVLDIIAIHGMYVILGCMIRSWGLELDTAVRARVESITDEKRFASAAKRFHNTARTTTM